MALKNDFFSDSLYDYLALPVSASEEDIQKAYDVLKMRVERGFMVTEEDKVKIIQLEPRLFDPEYRLRSMILKGDFGSDGLDLQLKRLKKMFAAKKIVAQEWIDVGSSLVVVLRSAEFSELLLNACALTRSKAGPDDQKALIQAVDSVFQALVDLQVAGVESTLKNFDRNTALEHLNIVEHFPGLLPNLRQKALESMLEHFWKPAQSKITEIKNYKASLASEKSEYNAKVLASRIEQETKDGLVPTYDLFSAHPFQNQKKYLDELRAVLEEVIKLLKESHKPEKADFFTQKLTGQVPAKSASPHSTTSILKSRKTSETQSLKPVPDKKAASEKNQDPASKTENVQEILQRLKTLASSGKPEEAKNRLLQEIHKAKTPDAKHSLESALQNPLYFLDPGTQPPKASFFHLLKKETEELAPGHVLYVLWFALGKSLPLIPLKAFAFNVETEECLGCIPLPRLKHRAQSYVAPVLGMTLLALAVPGYFFLSPSAQKRAETSYQTLHLTRSPEERLSQSLDFLSQDPFRETDFYAQVLQETGDLILDRLKIYESQGTIPDFMNRMSTVLSSLNKDLKHAILQQIAPRLEQHFVERNFEPADFLLWWMKTGTYGMAQSILSKKIESRLEKQDLKGVFQSLEVARKYSIRLPGVLVQGLMERKIASTGLALFLVSKFSDLPPEVWRSGILELWELKSPLSDDEGLLILEKVGDQLPDLRVDLLKSVLDKNKKNLIAWPSKVEVFQNASVEKRIKLLASRYEVQHGNYEAALNLSKTLPVHPENRLLYQLRLPLFFIQEQYFRVRHFFEMLHPAKDEFHEFLKGLAYTRTEEWTKGVRILGPLVNTRLQDYLALWKHLHEREDVVRKMVIEKLKSKKGSYYEVYRRIYLIQDDREAAREKEKFILSEIASDFKVKKIKEEIAENRYVHEGIFGWIEASLHQKDIGLLRKTEERLLKLKSAFSDPLTEIYLGQLYFLQGQQALAQKTLLNVEQSCWDNENYPPLLSLCKAYESLLWDVPLKKLTKAMLKKCKNSKICDGVYRFMAKTASVADQIEYFKEIREKNLLDEIHAVLAEIQQAKNHPAEAPLVAQMEKILQNSGRFFDTDHSPLLEALGDQLFLFYRLTHSTTALDSALTFFRKALMFRHGNSVLELKILHLLWFRVLDRLFSRPEISFLSDDFSLLYWHALVSKIESGQAVSVVETLNANADFQEIRILFHKILSKKIIWSSPPVFFDLLHTSGVELNLLEAMDFPNIEKKTFSQFWASDLPTQALLGNKLRTFLEAGEKSGSNYSKDASQQNADNLLKEGETILLDWVSKNLPIKGGFEKLLERLEFSKALKPNLVVRKLILDVKLARMAFRVDPNREWIGAFPLSWVIAKLVKEGRIPSDAELQSLLDEAGQIQETIKPFFSEDLQVLRGLQAGDPALIEKLSPKTQNLLKLETHLEPHSKKNQLRNQLFEKKN